VKTVGRVMTVLVLVTAAVLAGMAPGAAQVKIPPDYALEQGKDSPGVVTFSHEKHKEKVEKCTGCHTKVFKMKKGQTGPFTMAKMDAGESCGTCHNGKTQLGGKVVFATNDKAACENCHKKK
jgi:c(7)-type cytochrome triheme protein